MIQFRLDASNELRKQKYDTKGSHEQEQAAVANENARKRPFFLCHESKLYFVDKLLVQVISLP
jgi:hypothetical protein